LLRVEHLTKVFPDGTVALKDVSFEVEEGEFLAVIGLSGSGKSTLLRCVNRLIDPTEGKVIWEEQDVTAAKGKDLRRIRRQIGMIFQQFNLVKRSTVMTNVLSGRLGYAHPIWSLFHIFPHEEHERARAALDRVGIADKANNRADQLSGGQQQRVAIARALINNPSIILADEPTGNLDSHSGAEIMRIFQDLNEQQGITVIFVTHEPEIAQHTLRIIRLRDGLVISDAPVKNPRRAGERAYDKSVNDTANHGGPVSAAPDAVAEETSA